MVILNDRGRQRHRVFILTHKESTVQSISFSFYFLQIPRSWKCGNKINNALDILIILESVLKFSLKSLVFPLDGRMITLRVVSLIIKIRTKEFLDKLLIDYIMMHAARNCLRFCGRWLGPPIQILREEY